MISSVVRHIRWMLYSLRIIGRGKTWVQDDVLRGDLVYLRTPRWRKARYAKFTAQHVGVPEGIYIGSGEVTTEYLIYNGKPHFAESVDPITGVVVLNGYRYGVATITGTNQILIDLRFDASQKDDAS